MEINLKKIKKKEYIRGEREINVGTNDIVIQLSSAAQRAFYTHSPLARARVRCWGKTSFYTIGELIKLQARVQILN